MEETQQNAPEGVEMDGRSDIKVVMQFFIVPLSLVAVLVSLFFGLQFLRHRRPDPQATLKSLQHYDGFLGAVVGDLKRWQSGYDLSLLLRSQSPDDLKRLVPDLTAGLRDAGARGDLKLRRYLTLALGYASDPRAIEPLREALRDPDGETRLNAAWGLMRSGGEEALPPLRAALADPDPGVRKMAAFALGTLNDREAAPALRDALDDTVPDVGWNAALALARLNDPAAVPALLAMLEKALGDPPASDLAVNAIRGLALLRPPEAGEAFARAAASPDTAVRQAAEAGLQALGPVPDRLLTGPNPVAAAAPSEIR